MQIDPAESRNYLANYSTERIERAYGKWLDDARERPIPGGPPMDIDF